MSDVRVYVVPEGLDGYRADAGVAVMTGLSRAVCARIADEGGISSDSTGILKRSERLHVGDILQIALPEPERILPHSSGIALPVLYEDEDIVIIDKPWTHAAHPSLNFEGPDVIGTLVDMGVSLTGLGPQERAGIVHRLDVGTSGCMVVAKSDRAYSVLKQAFRDREVTKVYHALVQGHPDPFTGTIDAPIGRAQTKRWKMAVREDGRHAITHYKTREAMAGGTLLEVHLETGRTHQIRVHMAAIGHPCVGDQVYGADPTLSAKLQLERQWLHAYRLAFAHPRTGEHIEVEAPYPLDLIESLEQLRDGVFR